MRIYVDADAFPNVLKDILFRAAERMQVPLVFVACKRLSFGRSANISVIEVPIGPDLADDRIVELVQPGDLVITADIPLADRTITKGAFALNPRGELYTEENIKDRLAFRGLMNELRDCGLVTGGGPAEFTKKDRQAFANQLDRLVSRQLKREAL
ncbi:MAG: YaiI/YqxD family protein [Deltaproteobacteria bacterium]|nr:YaiI/YqxD family protein [Deltaproteobacteria bacterium]